MTETEERPQFEEPEGEPERRPDQDPAEGPGPPENPPADDDAVERGEDQLDQVSGN